MLNYSLRITDFTSGFTLASHVIFGLCNTLWGATDSDDQGDTKYVEQMRRKRMLESWLVGAIEADKSTGRRRHPPDTDSMDEIFRHVSDGRLEDAIKCALKSGGWLGLVKDSKVCFCF